MTDFANISDHLRGLLGNHPKAQYLRLTRAEAETIAATPDYQGRIDRRLLVELPPETEFGVTDKELAAKVVARHVYDPEADDNDPDHTWLVSAAEALLTSPYLSHEVSRPMDTMDRALRLICHDAAARLCELHERGELPRTGGFSVVDSALREVPEAVVWLRGLMDATVNAHAARERNQVFVGYIHNGDFVEAQVGDTIDNMPEGSRPLYAPKEPVQD